MKNVNFSGFESSDNSESGDVGSCGAQSTKIGSPIS
jgi:hypothetical protein